jgi:hypothetical protein
MTAVGLLDHQESRAIPRRCLLTKALNPSPSPPPPSPPPPPLRRNGRRRSAPERRLPPPPLLPHPPRGRNIGPRDDPGCAGGGRADSAAPDGWHPLGQVHGHLHPHVSIPRRPCPLVSLLGLVFHVLLRAISVSSIHFVTFSSEFGSICGRKPHVNVGTIGHVDHGKTTLTAAITKVGCVSHSVDSMLPCVPN